MAGEWKCAGGLSQMSALEGDPHLEEGERREWKRSRSVRLVPSRAAVWAARAGVTALVALIALMLIFAANALGWLGGVIR